MLTEQEWADIVLSAVEARLDELEQWLDRLEEGT